MGRSKSSNRWMQEHFDDEYVKLAQAKGYRSRAVFKLSEIQERDHIIKPGFTIVDLGAAPGGWSQFAREIVGKKNKIIALDILPIEPLEGVLFIQGDFSEATVLEQMNAVVDGARVNLVMSDMAPNMSGNKAVDQARSIYLAELALDTAKTMLIKDGNFLVKAFHGEGYEGYLQEVKRSFTSVVIRKPKASRPRSNEVYILAKGFK
ncbi:MAG: 23S rRNA (uridine(2552)-2'-O)-methyltransferase RlmE [Methylococcaceae bacterium]|nr:23S rRNA (uridine(2552)-2'-O)-methyltransferase RlmE [Methylococcaceae bacterium]